jgi:hypothetical protein
VVYIYSEKLYIIIVFKFFRRCISTRNHTIHPPPVTVPTSTCVGNTPPIKVVVVTGPSPPPAPAAGGRPLAAEGSSTSAAPHGCRIPLLRFLYYGHRLPRAGKEGEHAERTRGWNSKETDTSDMTDFFKIYLLFHNFSKIYSGSKYLQK